jgi:hypothetical protein
VLGAVESRPLAGVRAGSVSERDPWLAAIVGLSLLLFGFQLNWGLPNGNDSWAADAIGPVTALGLVHRSFAEWNSGWFWFKYPLGYPFLLVGSFLPYLGYLRLSMGWRPAAAWPHGFADPEHALYVLALSGRILSVAFAAGTVVLSHAIARRLFGRQAARLAALLVGTAYPIIYYAHTTNLDIGYLFWLVLALYAALRAASSERLGAWAGLGVAAAMALSTKEQSFAFLLPLPLLAMGARRRRLPASRFLWNGRVGVMAAAGLATLLVANNVLFNPLGFVARLAYLLGHPLEPVAARLAPVEFALWKGAKEWEYLTQLGDALDSALGRPLALLAAAGVAAVLRWRLAAAWLLLPALSYYYLSLRGLDLITLRYTLPLQVVAVLLAAGLLQGLHEAAGERAARRAVLGMSILLVALGVARAGELHRLFWNDPRYQAEAWLRDHMPEGGRVEVYQKPAYLPRFGKEFSVVRVPLQDRSVAGLAARAPDLIVLSSASAKSITHTWNPDWRTTRTLLLPKLEAVEMRRALDAGVLPYRPAASFREPQRFLRLRITSLAPKITIHARHPQ